MPVFSIDTHLNDIRIFHKAKTPTLKLMLKLK